jgi:FkbH-like protein
MSTALKYTTLSGEIPADILGADFRSFSAKDVALACRRLRTVALEPQVRIAYLGSHTLEPLPDYVTVRNACDGIVTRHMVGEFNQYFQCVLDEQSGLVAFDPHLIFLSLSMRDLAPRICHQFGLLSDEAKREESRKILSIISEWIAAAEKTTNASLVICNFCAPERAQIGIADLKSDSGETEFYLRLNLDLLQLLRPNSRAFLLDLDRVASRVGKSAMFSPQMYYLARMEWEERLLPELADELTRYVRALLGRTRKCLVLDLDNTLWGGVLGEEGPAGIKVGPGDPESEAYLSFQHQVRALKSRGVILAIASKNNLEDVTEAFASRKDMPLKLDDFSAIEINWNNKHESLLKIAEGLNIGPESLVFVDDSPAECALVRQMLPEVTVVQLPPDPADFADLIKRIPEFETLQITEEDRRKARQYFENRKRRDRQRMFGDTRAYLRSLETKVTVRRPSPGDVPRIHQLFLKTNQFNLTTRRYSRSNVARFLSEPRHELYVVDASDHFGDMGTIGLVLIDTAADEPSIDSFLMSCRAMGREIETAIMNSIKHVYLTPGRVPALRAVYVPTAKNSPAKCFYEKQGFTLVDSSPTGAKTYRLSASDAHLIDCAHIDVSMGERSDESKHDSSLECGE